MSWPMLLIMFFNFIVGFTDIYVAGLNIVFDFALVFGCRWPICSVFSGIGVPGVSGWR